MKVRQSEYNCTANVKTVSDVNLLSRHKIKESQNTKDIIEFNKELKYILPAVGCRGVEFTYAIKTNQITVKTIISDQEQVKIKIENLPKELREITNPIQLDKFLKNTYAKISTLSDGEYKLYINHKLLGGDEEYYKKLEQNEAA